MSLATLICLPWIVIIVIFFGAMIINIVKGDHVFRPSIAANMERR